jgi:hypothetical protein
MREMAMALDSPYPTTRGATNNGGLPDERVSPSLDDGDEVAPRSLPERRFGFRLRDLVYREPWLAIAATFAIGYFAARFIRRVS